jgi:2'-5' RNA ligase
MLDPHESETSGYHLFLIPGGGLLTELRLLVADLAATYDGPIFDPHVTLLSHIAGAEEDIVAKAAELAKALHPFQLSFRDIGMEDAFFRALYARANPSPELANAHATAVKIFDVHDEPLYIPHLSLLYGNLSPEAKTEIARTLVLPNDFQFRVDEIHVYRTEGPATEWVPVATQALQ